MGRAYPQSNADSEETMYKFPTCTTDNTPEISLKGEDLVFVSKCAYAAFLISERLDAIKDKTKTEMFDNDILALQNMALGLGLILDRAEKTSTVQPEYN